jgi:type I restriction enzyme S subunit
MEVKEGYKQTEVGVIPEDWDVKHLRPMLKQKPSYGINAAAVPLKGDLPVYIRITDISDEGYFMPSQRVGVDHPLSEKYYLENGDLVFARTGASVGKSYLYNPNDGKLVYAGFLIKIKPDERILSPAYLAQYVKTQTYWGWVQIMSMRSGQPGINGNEYGQLLLPLPPTKAEQTAIATALSDTDALINSMEELIAKKRNIKQGAMQELLSCKKRLPGFSGKWEVKKLGEIGEITGAGVDKKIKPDEVPVRLVNYLDVYRRDFIYSRYLNHHVTAPPTQAQRCSVKKGDIFFTPSSEMPFDIGISAVAMEDIPDAAYSYHVVRLRLNEDWDLAFRAYIFKTRYFLNQAETFCEGSGTRYVITQKRFRELTIYYPIDKAEQTAIDTIFGDMDAEIEALEAKLEKYKMVKQGMMQELLTGKTRLI